MKNATRWPSLLLAVLFCLSAAACNLLEPADYKAACDAIPEPDRASFATYKQYVFAYNAYVQEYNACLVEAAD